MDLTLTKSLSLLQYRYLAVICGSGVSIVLSAASRDVSPYQFGLSGALICLAFVSTLGLVLWGMIAPNGQPKSKHLSERLADAGPSFAGAFALAGSLLI